MIRLLSVIMACFNKRQILINTLRSIEHFGVNYPMEIIVVDDASDEKIDDIPVLFKELNIRLIIIKRKVAKWRNPTNAMNTALNFVRGDAVMINNADCLHMGDIIGYVFRNFNFSSYLTFSAYKGAKLPTGIFDDIDWNDEAMVKKLFDNVHPEISDNWHFHTLTNPSYDKFSYIPYVAVLSTKNMEALSGYDERYSGGIGLEDSDILVRIHNLGLKIIHVDYPFCVHQKHPPIVYNDSTNEDFFFELQRTEPNRIKAQHNRIFVR